MTAPQTTEFKSPPPYGWAAATAVLLFGIYVATLGPTIAFWDTPEYVAAAKVLGIPHPPGNPLFVIMAHAWGLLPLAASYAARINLFAAVTSALSAGLWFLVAERWLRALVPERGARLAAAFAGILVGATSWTVWNQSTVNEKVYTVSLLSTAAVMWLVVHWGDDKPSAHRDRWLILIGYILTLSSTNHMMGVLAAPAVAIYVVWTDWREALRPWVLLLGWLVLIAVTGTWTNITAVGEGHVTGLLLLLVTASLLVWSVLRDPKNPAPWLALVAVVVGVSLNYIFLPLRAAQFPPINEGEPTTWQALLDVLNRVQYGKPSVLVRQADIGAQLANYWQYFTWQFARDWGAFGRVATAFFAVLGLTGLWQLLRKDRRAGLAALVMLVLLTLALILYLNFKYGFSMYPDRPSLQREVRERDYFFVGSFAYFGTLVALGFGVLLQQVLALLRREGESRKPWVLAAPVLLLGLVPFFGNRGSASRAHETIPRDFAADLLESIEPYGILITAGDNDTFPLWFAQEVEGIRRDVTLANLSLMNTEWHLKQIRRRDTPDFDPSKAAPIWRPSEPGVGGAVQAWPKPTTPVFAMTEEEIVGLPEVMRAPAQGTLRFDSVVVRLGSDILDRKDLATIFLIKDNIGKRPIYFSWSDAGYPDQTLGLTPYLVTHGLVRKLNPVPLHENPPVILSEGMGYVDLDRTRNLLWNVYHWKAAARPRPHGWYDPPSVSILSLYAIIYGGLAPTFRVHGDSVSAARADSVANAVEAALRPR